MSYAGPQNQSFEPVYSALAALLIDSATVAFTGDFTEGDAVVANVANAALLTVGLAAISAPLIPQGSVIQTIAGTSVTLTLAPTGSGLAQPATAGYASIDPVAARLLRHWSDVPASQQPALFLAQTGEVPEKRPGQLTKWTLDAMAYVYCYAPDDRTPVAPTMNVLLGALRGCFGPDASGPGRAQGRRTLGGLVFDTWIAGKIETDEGFLGQQGVAKVPIRIIQNGP
jgi:hypothetical protein